MRVAVLVLVVATGCPPALDDYVVVGDDGGVVPPRRDSSLPPVGCRFAVTCAAGCGRPWLLAAAEDLPGGEECGGRIARWSLADRDSICSCAPLGDASTPGLMRAIGVYPPSTIVVGSENEYLAFDGGSGALRWRVSGNGDIPGSIFAIQTTDGQPRIAIGLKRGNDVRSISVRELADGAQTDEWIANDGTFPLGLSISSLTQDPREPSHFMAVKLGTYGAAEIDPWMQVRLEPPYVRDREGFVLRSVHSLFHDPFFHTAWAGEENGEPAVFNLQRSDFVSDNGVPLGSSCNNMTCDGYPHAVADPTLNTGMIALCSQSGIRQIVRLASTNSTCTVLAREDELPPSFRLAQLAIATDSFWP